MEKDKISVIVPVFNVEKYIHKCLDSIIYQTYKNLEIILVDDGSTDSSGKVCDEYARKDSRIIVVHKNNGGLSDARNKALDICTGEYVAFVDSDDFVSPVFVEVLYSVLHEGHCDLVALDHGTSFWDEEQEPCLACSLEESVVEYIAPKDGLERMLYQHIATSTQTKFIKKSLIDKIRFPFGFLYEDVATTYKFFLVSKKTAIVNSELYAYRKRRDSIIRQKFSDKKMCSLKIFDQLVTDEDLINHGMSEAAKCRAFSMLYSVFLQVDTWDKEHKTILWTKLQTVQKSIRHNRSPLMRKKAKYAAWISLLGMNLSYKIGRIIGQKGTFN